MPYFKRDKLVKDLDDYNAFVEEIIKAKYGEIDEGTDSREDLIKALILANNETDETKLSLEEIRVI
jgi:cytochrome P450